MAAARPVPASQKLTGPAAWSVRSTRVILGGMGVESRGPAVGFGILVVAAGMVAALAAGDGPADERAVPGPASTLAGGGPLDAAGAPESFYAVRDPTPPPPGEPPDDNQIVEVETATGRIIRTVVDLGDSGEPGEAPHPVIDALDLTPDGRTLWYSGNESVFRVALPDGTPEEIAAGHDPAVSSDGRRLAWIVTVPGEYDPRFRIRNLDDGSEQTVETDALSLEGSATTWSADGTKLAFSTGGADAFYVASIDIATGRAISPEGTGELKGPWYTPYAPRYRPSDGLLVVACCGEIPDPPPDLVPPPPAFVFHDPDTGAERERITLPVTPGAHDYDASGAHHLVSAVEGNVYLEHDGELRRIPNITGVSELAW